MKAAWYASIAAQIVLVAALWRCGRRDWWLVYLVADLARTAVMLPLTGSAYWLASVLTEPLAMALRFLAVLQVSPASAREAAMVCGSSMTAWAVVLTPAGWPTMRRASLLLHQAGAFGCFAVLAIGAALRPAACDWWMLTYFGLMVARAIAEQVTIHQTATINVVHLTALTLLFLVWSFHKNGGLISDRHAR